ncbi:MAG: cache domain-containing protein [Burkholderiales bacterium]
MALPLAGAIAYVWWKSLQEGRALAVELLRANVTQVSHDLQSLGGQAEWVLSQMARRPAVAELKPGACALEAAALRDMNPVFLLVTLWTRDGTLVCSSIPVDASRPPPQPHRQAFDAGIATDGLYLSNLFFGPITGLPLVTYTYPVRDRAGKLVGLLSLPIRMDHFEELLLSLQHHKGSTASILDAAGTYVARVPDAAKWRGKPGAGTPMVAAASRDTRGVAVIGAAARSGTHLCVSGSARYRLAGRVRHRQRHAVRRVPRATDAGHRHIPSRHRVQPRVRIPDCARHTRAPA